MDEGTTRPTAAPRAAGAPRRCAGLLGPWVRALVLAAAATMLAAAPVRATPSAPVATGASVTPLATFSTLEVDPQSGRVYLSGDDAVVVYASDGTLLGRVDGLPGAGGMAFTGDRLWVAQTDAASIAEIDPTTLAKLDEHPAGGPMPRSIAAVGGKIWFTGPYNSGTDFPLKALDPASGTVSSHGFVRGSELLAIPGATNRLVASANGGGTARSTFLYDLATDPVTSLGNTNLSGGNLRGVAATDAGTLLTAAGAPYRFDEVSTTPDAGLLRPTGVVYDSDAYPTAIAWSPGSGGVLAGTTWSDDLLWVFRPGVPTPTHVIELAGSPMRYGLGLSTDGLRTYSVTQSAGGPVVLTTRSLAPTLTAASTTSFPRGRSTTSVLHGTGLGSITSATLGGAPVDLAHDGPDRVEFRVRTELDAGPATVLLEGPFGDLSLPVTVTANGSGMLSGVVHDAGAPVAGATVTLTDDRGSARSTTTAASGTYAFTGVPNGDHYDLEVTKGPASHGWRDQVLDGAGPWTYDLDLHAPPAAGPLRRLDLPPGAVRRLVHDPASGRTFVAVGDEIVVLDADGRIVERIPDQWTVTDLQVAGSKLYALKHRAAEISIIDTATLAVTSTVAVPVLTPGSFAVAGNRAYLGNTGDQWAALVSVDLTTGAVSSPCYCQLYQPQLAPVDGAPLQFLSWSVDGASGVDRWDATSPTAASLGAASGASLDYSPGDLVASSAADRAWTANGRELVLSTMTPSGTTYPVAPGFRRSVARSAGHGGVLAFDQTVARQGIATATHLLPATPAPRASALDAAGDRSYVATAAGELVVTDLAPRVTTVEPARAETTPATVELTGSGLGGTTTVKVDGTTVPHSVVDAATLSVSLPKLGAGRHLVAVTTPWGSSSPVSFRTGPRRHPFASWSALVKRQFTDLTGRPPSTASLVSWVTKLDAGTATPGDLVAALRRSADNTANVDPVARLYRAFLGRTPDASGLAFWVGRKRAGTWSVTRMADSFAASTEFERTYGTLTDRQFVTRIYTDVLGRPADAAGVDYWTGKLARREKSRGQVMVGFSESSEYRRKQAEATDVAVAFSFLLGRAPTTAEASSWIARQRTGTPAAVLAGELLASRRYAARVAG
ncbi:DUF4214 domain-containing protein [Aquihabitans daechungensis]|uniref:DUF4214 domain-containing protein n=1 Tax=Aquihabitans daechungensis TaxID=1052257 RepID=UPI003BA1BA98